MTFLNIINHLKENTSKIISEKGYDNVDFVVEYSRSGFGDITCNVAFLLAKNLKKNPQEVAQEFAGEYNLGNDLEKVEAHKSGYLNFFINNNSFTNTVLPESLKENYGSVNIGKNSKLIVEHTSVNPNKALHIGHLRNVAIGDAVSRILSKANYDVKVLNIEFQIQNSNNRMMHQDSTLYPIDQIKFFWSMSSQILQYQTLDPLILLKFHVV